MKGKVKIVPNPESGMFLTEEDLEKIQTLTSVNVELPSIARALNLDEERFMAEYQTPGSLVREAVDKALAKMEIDEKIELSERVRSGNDKPALAMARKEATQARWSEKEKQLIIVLYVRQKKSMKEIASILKRPVRSVESQLRRLGCLKTPDWSSDDEQYLIENHEKLSNEQLSVILKKSKNAIAIKKHRLCSK